MPGPSLGRIQGYPRGEWRRREEALETSLCEAKSVAYFLTAVYIPSLRKYPRYEMLTHAHTGLV